jgi:hypothetical protein
VANINWNDPRAADPVAGQPGHFDHHNWIKESLKILEDRLKLVEAATAPLPTASDPNDELDLSGAANTDAKLMTLITYLDDHGTVIYGG